MCRLPHGMTQGSRAGLDNQMLKVLLVEDSAVVRQRLLQSIATIPNIEVVGEYEDANAAITAVQQLLPDVILLDIRLRTGSGMSVLKHTVLTHPAARVVVLTNYTEPQYRATCLGNGAHYFFDKSNEFDKVPALLAQLAESL